MWTEMTLVIWQTKPSTNRRQSVDNNTITRTCCEIGLNDVDNVICRRRTIGRMSVAETRNTSERIVGRQTVIAVFTPSVQIVSRVPLITGLNNEPYYKDHYNDAGQTVKKSGEGMKVGKYEFLIDGKKSVMMTMRRRSLAYCSRLELRQPERHGCQR